MFDKFNIEINQIVWKKDFIKYGSSILNDGSIYSNNHPHFLDYIIKISKNKKISIGKLNTKIIALKEIGEKVDQNNQKITFAETAIKFINSLSELNTPSNN